MATQRAPSRDPVRAHARRRVQTPLGAALLAALLACGGGEETPAPRGEAPTAEAPSTPQTPSPAPASPGAEPAAPAAPDPGAAARAEAERVFATRCVTCHGPEGRGDGPGAVALSPKPRDYTDRAWQASVSDEELRRIIIQGGAAVGKSVAMPPNPDLAARPEVVEALVAHIRELGGT